MISATLASGGGGVAVTITADSSFPDQPLIATPRGIRGGLADAVLLATTQRCFFDYVGYWPAGVVFKYVEFLPSNGGTNSLIEVGLFSSTSAPNKNGQLLTRLVSGTVSIPLTLNVANRNSDAFASTLATASFLWCGFRSVNTANPQLRGLSFDMGQGHGLILGGTTPAFSATTGFTATLSGSSEPSVPDLRATMI